MNRANFDGIELEYIVEGSGEPVILIHGSIYANYLSVLQREAILTKNYRVVSYSRRGFGGSTHPKGPLTIAEQASDCRELMRYLNLEKAHLVGHSYGGVIALQFALDYPSAANTLSLLEPGLMGQVPSGQQFFQSIAPVVEMYKSGDRAAAISAFVTGVAGPDGLTVIEKAIPGAMEQAIKDLDTFFQIELPAYQSWNFTAKDAERIKQHVLSVVGQDSIPIFKEINQLIRGWFPQSETAVIPKANHVMPFQNPGGVAEALSTFFARST